MSDELLIEQCSPTLAGIKTANLFSCRFSTKKSLMDEIRSLNRILAPKGIRVLPINLDGNRALIYIYRPKKLQEDLNDFQALDILLAMGYKNNAPHRCIMELMKRFHSQEEFPHEIGLFLGYPPEDVKGFIEHKKDGCKCQGYWKVYGDVNKARKCFDSYKECTEMFKNRYFHGYSIEELTVAV